MTQHFMFIGSAKARLSSSTRLLHLLIPMYLTLSALDKSRRDDVLLLTQLALKLADVGYVLLNCNIVTLIMQTHGKEA